MKRTIEQYKRALQLCGVNVARVTIDTSPIKCVDEENRPFTHTNGVQWFQFDHDMNQVARGWITLGLRVSRYGNDKNLTGHVVLPYGGSWKSELETLFQNFRWNGDWNTG